MLASRRLYKSLGGFSDEIAKAFPIIKKHATELIHKQDGKERWDWFAISVLLSGTYGNLNQMTYKEAPSVLCYCPSKKMQAKEADVKVLWIDGQVKPLREISTEDRLTSQKVTTIIQSHERLWRFLVFTHPRYVYRDDERGIIRKRKRLGLFRCDETIHQQDQLFH